MEQNFLSLSGNLFTFRNCKCECLVDIGHLPNGKETKALRIRSRKDEDFLFAYMPQEGLVQINPVTGAVISTNIFSDLLSIPVNNLNKLIAFFQNNGFFIPISSTEYETFLCADVYAVHRRIKYTSELISLLESGHKDYNRILEVTFWLVFMRPTTINPGGQDLQEYQTCTHSVHQYLNGPDSSQENEELLHKSPNADPTEAYYLIPDTIRSPETRIAYYDYQTKVYASSGDTYDEPDGILNLRTLTFAFKNYVNVSPKHRRMIEFLYHFRTEIGAVAGISENGTLSFSCDVADRYRKYFDASMKSALIDVAKLTIKEEIDYALYGITPSYNTENMTASWYIPDLIAGLYFSLFYMKPDVEIYRQCANPNCSRFFLVKTTNSRKKYCCSECANAVSQRMHRKRLIEKKNGVLAIQANTPEESG